MLQETLLTLLILLFYTNVNGQGIIPVKWYFENKYVFGFGYWVYQDTVSSEIDSITLIATTHGYISPTPIIPDYEEYYLMEMQSHTQNYSYNEFIISQYWKRNGGGMYGELGQPVMHIGQYDTWPEVGNGFNGYEIMGMFDNLQVGDEIFNNVVWTHIYENEQYQYEFDYDTDLFFAEFVGIIRKEYTDDMGVHHVWNLINYETGGISTDIDDFSFENNTGSIYPNPVFGILNIDTEEEVNTVICDISGRILLTTSGKQIDVSTLSPGSYLAILRNKAGLAVHQEIVLKR